MELLPLKHSSQNTSQVKFLRQYLSNVIQTHLQIKCFKCEPWFFATEQCRYIITPIWLLSFSDIFSILRTCNSDLPVSIKSLDNLELLHREKKLDAEYSYKSICTIISRYTAVSVSVTSINNYVFLLILGYILPKNVTSNNRVWHCIITAPRNSS